MELKTAFVSTGPELKWAELKNKTKQNKVISQYEYLTRFVIGQMTQLTRKQLVSCLGQVQTKPNLFYLGYLESARENFRNKQLKFGLDESNQNLLLQYFTENSLTANTRFYCFTSCALSELGDTLQFTFTGSFLFYFYLIEIHFNQ